VNRVRSKNILWITLVTLVLTTALTANINITLSSGSPTVYVYPDLITQSSGDFTVEIRIADVTSAESLYSWEFKLVFNPGLLEITGVTRGPFLRDAVLPQGYTTAFSKKIDNFLGTVDAGESVWPKWPPFPKYPPIGATSSGTLATIDVHIKGTGASRLSFDSSNLFTVISNTPVEIDHEASEGVFDNRGGVNADPNPLFDVNLVAMEGELLKFDGSLSTDDAWIVNYEWDFDYDGVTFDVDGTGINAFNAYAVEGIYTPALRVTDGPDGVSVIGYKDVQVFVWIEGGTFPDLVQKCAWPEKPKWYEATDGQLVPFHARVGNPTSETCEVYVEFALLSKDEGTALGKIETVPQTLVGGQILDVTATLDLTDNTWICLSGSPEWVGYGYYTGGGMRKYAVFARCYYDNGTGYKLGNVVKYFHFNVYPAYHDIGVDMWTSADRVEQGDDLTIYANITNNGDLSETFVTKVHYKSELAEEIIEEREVTVAAGVTATETFVWNTDSLPLGTYIVKVTLPVSTYEYPRDTGDQEDIAVVFIDPPS
jgi:hypothetical protein